jgi:hypothetical protein
VSGLVRPFMQATEEFLAQLDGGPNFTHFVTADGQTLPVPDSWGDSVEKLRSVFFEGMRRYPEHVIGGNTLNNPTGQYQFREAVQPPNVRPAVVEEIVYIDEGW